MIMLPVKSIFFPFWMLKFTSVFCVYVCVHLCVHLCMCTCVCVPSYQAHNALISLVLVWVVAA